MWLSPLDSKSIERRIGSWGYHADSSQKKFKLAAVRRLEQGVSMAEAARGLEVSPNVLQRWRKGFRAGTGNAFPGNGKQRWSDGKVAELERRIGHAPQNHAYHPVQIVEAVLRGFANRAQKRFARILASNRSSCRSNSATTLRPFCFRSAT
jgi:transposase-like protein